MAKRLSALHTGRALVARINVSASGTHFCQRLSKSQGPVRLEGLGKLETFIHFIDFGTRNITACSVVPQPLRKRVL
jgi:hypothetical protein